MASKARLFYPDKLKTFGREIPKNFRGGGIIWYHKNVEESLKFKKIIVASNNKNEILNKNVVNINLDKN